MKWSVAECRRNKIEGRLVGISTLALHVLYVWWWVWFVYVFFFFCHGCMCGAWWRPLFVDLIISFIRGSLSKEHLNIRIIEQVRSRRCCTFEILRNCIFWCAQVVIWIVVAFLHSSQRNKLNDFHTLIFFLGILPLCHRRTCLVRFFFFS